MKFSRTARRALLAGCIFLLFTADHIWRSAAPTEPALRSIANPCAGDQSPFALPLGVAFRETCRPFSSLDSPADAFWLDDPLGTDRSGPQQSAWRDAFWNDYPFTADDFHRAFNPGDVCLFSKVFDALDAGEHIRIVAVGGSMTFGIGCADDRRAMNCAWPNEFGTWLSLVKPSWNFSVVNQGLGGRYAGHWAASPELQPADIYIVDTLVNSIQLHQVDVPLAYDALFWRLLHTESPAVGGPPAILSLQTLPQLNRAETAAYEAAVASHYGAPSASFLQLVVPDLSEPYRPDLFTQIWSDPDKAPEYGTHPGKVAHELVSDVVKYAFLRLLSNRTNEQERTCRNHFTPATHPGIGAGTCWTLPSGPVSTLSPSGVFEPLSNFGWRLYEDVPRKPGWIVDRDDGSSANITFMVGFSAFPRLEVFFLQSYRGMASARMTLAINDCTWSYVLHGNITEPFSVSMGAMLGQPAPRGRRLLPASIELGDFPRPTCGFSPGTLYPLTFEAPVLGKGKFKILSITSC